MTIDLQSLLAGGKVLAEQAGAPAGLLPSELLELMKAPRLNAAGLAWAAGIQFAADEIATYGGNTWIANRANIGVTPVPGLDWALLAAAGADASSVVAGPGAVSANFSTTSTSFVDVTGMSAAPVTTSPVVLHALGQLVAIDNGSATGAATVSAQILDDLGAILALQSFQCVVGASQAVSQPLVLAEIDVTPASTARTYKVQLKTSVSTVTARIVGPAQAGGHKGRLKVNTP